MNEAQEDERALALLRKLPTTALGAEIRVSRRLFSPRRRTWSHTWRAAWSVGRVPAALALAAGVALVWRDPAPPPVEPEPVTSTLAADGSWVTDTAIPGVTLSFLGTGSVGGSTRAPEIRWERGTLHVEVTPGAGLHVAVETGEATVRVVGTGFTVMRDELGTHVEVRHGRVDVTCGEEPAESLGPAEALDCLPRSSGALLHRARTLQARGAAPALVLDAADRGLALGSNAALRDELRVARMRALGELGRDRDALAEAQAYLADGEGARRTAVLGMAVAFAKELGGCEAAAPWLLTLDDGARQRCEE